MIYFLMTMEGLTMIVSSILWYISNVNKVSLGFKQVALCSPSSFFWFISPRFAAVFPSRMLLSLGAPDLKGRLSFR